MLPREMDDQHSRALAAQAGFRRLMGMHATGVAIIAVPGPNGPHGMTANSLTSVSLDPPLLLFCARKGTRTEALVTSSQRFSVNVLSSEQVGVSRFFAGQTAHDCDVKWATSDGMPVLAEAEAAFICQLLNIYDGGDHSIFVGRVTSMQGRRKPRSPLVYYRRSYRTVRACALPGDWPRSPNGCAAVTIADDRDE